MNEKFRPVIDKWPSLRALAADLGAPYESVKKWRQRDSIPPDYWPVLVSAASERGIALSLSGLHAMAARAA